jgi:hypothetical protein
MAQQIKKKFLSPEVINYFDDQINLVESSVTSEETARIAGDSALDSRITALEGQVGEDLQEAISGLESSISAEQSARQSADSALDARITSLEGQVGEDLQEAISDLEAAIAAEATSRGNADSNLQSQIDTEKGRVDAILLASTADKDSFAEIVQLINSVDTENDNAFAGYVSSNNAALAQEVLDRQSGDASTLQASKDYTDAQIAEIPSVDLSGYYTKAEVDAKESALASDISDLDVYAQDLRSDVDSLEVYAQDIRSDVDENTSSISSHASRLTALEAQTDGPSFSNEKLVVGANLEYVELSRECIKIMSCAVGRMAVHEGEDFTVSVVGGKTRLTWIGSLLHPGGQEAIETGDNVFVVYAY